MCDWLRDNIKEKYKKVKIFKMQPNLCKKIPIIGVATDNIYNIILVEARNMKFCDKLAKLRKNNNLSQEQFADKMGVSRQAVSKWESGASYPDMDKILTMCKILNCNLEDLLDDGVIGDAKSNNKINFNNYFNDFLNFITKSYNMFWSMKLKEKVKCLFELFIIFMILLITGAIIYALTYELILCNITNLPGIGYIFTVFDPLLLMLLIVLGTIIFLHLFKIRYLDYFITVEDSNALEKSTEKALEDEKIIDNKKYIVERPKEKIVIRDPKHSTFNFFNMLGKLTLYMIKFFVIIFIIPFIMFIIMMIAAGTISLSFIKYGLLFLFIFLAILGAVLISFIIIYFAYNFIFNKEIKFKLMFILFIVGLVLVGIGSGMAAINFMDYDYKEISSDRIETKENRIEMKDNIILSDIHSNIRYTIDDSIDDIKLKITVPKGYECTLYTNTSDKYEVYHLGYDGFNLFEAYDYVKEDLKKHQISKIDNIIKVDVYVSQKNYDILMQNEEHYEDHYEEYYY